MKNPPSFNCPRPDQTVAEVLSVWPRTIRVFLNSRMDCVGCTMSAFDTVSDAVSNYGGALDDFLAELTQAIQEERSSR
jgi:hybrid cluster-associated redox disulfide protein